MYVLSVCRWRQQDADGAHAGQDDALEELLMIAARACMPSFFDAVAAPCAAAMLCGGGAFFGQRGSALFDQKEHVIAEDSTSAALCQMAS